MALIDNKSTTMLEELRIALKDSDAIDIHVAYSCQLVWISLQKSPRIDWDSEDVDLKVQMRTG